MVIVRVSYGLGRNLRHRSGTGRVAEMVDPHSSTTDPTARIRPAVGIIHFPRVSHTEGTHREGTENADAILRNREMNLLNYE